MDDTPKHIIQLTSIPGLGLGKYYRLIDRFKSIDGVFKASHSQLCEVLTPELARAVVDKFSSGHNSSNHNEYADRVLSWCDHNHVAVITHQDAQYPALLSEIKRGPPLLFVRGNVDVLRVPQVAIVGSRACSQGGRKSAFNIAAELCDLGLAVTSGLALGIDTEAHRGALSTNGRTIAVLGTGIDSIYPHKNRSLSEHIIEQDGAIVSEFPLGTKAKPENFPQRNRIVSGLALGALVVEAAIKSGSLITARFALEQNREVFAVPGSIHNPLSKGPHALIKEGACLVESAHDIVDQLSIFLPRLGSAAATETYHAEWAKLSPQAQEILSVIGYEPTSIEDISSLSNTDVGELIAVLMDLELSGWTCQSAAGFVRLPR